MKKACVIGWPIEHSRSPLIHGYWLKKYGIEGSYTKVAVKPEEVGDFLRALGKNGFAGCNVTVPHKETAFAAAHDRTAAAKAIGAANTIWLENGRLAADNTDAFGFMTHLALTAPQWMHGDRPISILGAGGAARAIVYGFLESGVREVRLFNRTRERADALAGHFGPRVKVLGWDTRSLGSRECSVIVNTTTLGMKGVGDAIIDFADVQHGAIAADIVYVPLETAFLKAARARGLRTVDGLGMLMHQAVPGFEKWFGVKPEVTLELRAILEADIRGAA